MTQDSTHQQHQRDGKVESRQSTWTKILNLVVGGTSTTTAAITSFFPISSDPILLFLSSWNSDSLSHVSCVSSCINCSLINDMTLSLFFFTLQKKTLLYFPLWYFFSQQVTFSKRYPKLYAISWAHRISCLSTWWCHYVYVTLFMFRQCTFAIIIISVIHSPLLSLTQVDKEAKKLHGKVKRKWCFMCEYKWMKGTSCSCDDVLDDLLLKWKRL